MKNKTTSLMTGMLSAIDSANTDSGAAEDVPSAGDEKGGYGGNMDNDRGPNIDFLKDDVQEMTYARRIALKLMDKPWYNPMCNEEEEEEEKKDDGSNDSKNSDEEHEDGSASPIEDFDTDISFEKPCLAKGWAFFEHQTLYRYLLPEGYGQKKKKNIFTRVFRTLFMHKNKKFEKAEPGEDMNPSRLYPIWVPHNQLGDFGIGIGLYFSNLRALIFISFVCGCISLGNILYFASEEYDNNNDIIELTFSTLAMSGSAACSAREWVPCPTCDCSTRLESRMDGKLFDSRCANATNEIDGTELIFALKNNCDGTPFFLAASNFATVVFMIIATFLLGMYMKREEVKFDEDEQTAQDYSIQIKNPPPDANDPEEWRRFFKNNCDGAQVVVCTCAVENDLLVKALMERRKTIRSIQSLQPGESIDMIDIAKNAANIERERTLYRRLLAKVVPGIPEHYNRLVCLKGRVEGMAQLNYSVSNVFVTFETEEDQRKVLEKLSVGHKSSMKNDKKALSDDKYLFREAFVLDVCQPEEPSTILWEDLNAGLKKRLKQQLYTLIWTLLSLTVVFFVIYYSNVYLGTIFAAYAITIFNAIFPHIAKAMTNHLETHTSESQKQASLYYKIVLFRWVASVLIFWFIIPFTETLTHTENGIIAKIYALFFSDITFGSAIRLLDPVGHLKRHILAPRAKTQDQMNLLFRGKQYELAEPYSDMTKILFLSMFYCAIFPTSSFLCTISLTAKYFVDRFTLVRSWQRAPAVGPAISSIGRRYVMTIAVAIMAIACSYYWTGFPFDNICLDKDSPVNASYVGNYTVSTKQDVYQPDITDALVTEDDFNYRFCGMDFTERGWNFPFVPSQRNEFLDPSEYMNDEQMISTEYFGWSAFAFMLLIILKYFKSWYTQFQKLHNGGYKAVGVTQGIPYHEVPSRNAYIPQVNSDEFAFPLIACKVDDIDEELFDFEDPYRSYKYYDITVDADKITAANKKIKQSQSFTIVKSWPPEKND